jgi:hypothetical protein
MAKVLFLESCWSNESDGNDFLLNRRSAAKLYSALEMLGSTWQSPLITVNRPLLAKRFQPDIQAFVRLEHNRRGPNAVVLSAHGGEKISNRRPIVSDYLGRHVDLWKEFGELAGSLQRTIIFLDSCVLGSDAAALRLRADCLGVISFGADVGWTDAAILILAILTKFQEEGVFHMERASPVRPRQILESMTGGAYQSLCESLALDHAFSG